MVKVIVSHNDPVNVCDVCNLCVVLENCQIRAYVVGAVACHVGACVVGAVACHVGAYVLNGTFLSQTVTCCGTV